MRRVTLRRATPLRILTLAYKAPAFTHKDWLPLMIALNHLTGGETSPLYKALVDTHLATDVTTALYPTHDPFLAFFTVHGSENVAYENIESALIKVLEAEKKKLLSHKKLMLLKESLLAEEANSRDGSRNVALALSEYVATGDWKQYPNTYRDIERISADDVMRVMRTYLNVDTATIGTLHTP
jgi:zinc protease